MNDTKGHNHLSADIVEAVTDELLAHGEFSSGANNRSNAREAARVVVGMVRTFDAAQPTRKYDLRAFARFLYEHCALDPDKAGDVAATILSEYDVRPDDCASQPSPAATVEVVRVPKVRTSHHRNKEEAARLQALVDQRYTRSSAGNAGLRAALQDIVTVIPSNQGGTQGAIRRTAVAALEQFPLTETEPQTPVAPDGYVLVPRRLTAENGAKAALIGEFHEDFGLQDERGRETWAKVAVTWTTIKAIHRKMVEHFDGQSLSRPQSEGGK